MTKKNTPDLGCARLGLAADDDYLDIIECAHRSNVGNLFCYAAVRYNPKSRELWRLAIVRKTEHGYYPISDDFFLGTEHEAESAAARLNSARLDLTRRDASRIVGASMALERRAS